MSNEVYEVSIVNQEHLPIKLLYITKARYDIDWHSTNHAHHFTEILYITRGKGTFIFSHEQVPVKEQDLIIINPHVEHTEKSCHNHPLEYIAVGIEGFAFTTPDSPEQVTFLNYIEEKNIYLSYLEQLLEEAESQQNDYELILRNIIEILLLKMLRKKNLNLEKISSQKISKDIAFTKNFIKQHFREKINLDILAKASHMNKYYLSHSFKKLVGLSPIEYLIDIRIRESKILLETTNYPISDISNIIGFSSQSLFSQAFKRETNMTPSQYRKSKSSK